MRRTFPALALLLSLIAAGSVSGQEAAPAAAAAQAAVPRLIMFSGRLRDLAGKPVGGAVDVTFGLHSEETDGSPLWFETQTRQADRLGHYIAMLGAMLPNGVPMELVTSGRAHWLGVHVSKTGVIGETYDQLNGWAGYFIGDVSLWGAPGAGIYLMSPDGAHCPSITLTNSGTATPKPQTCPSAGAITKKVGGGRPLVLMKQHAAVK